MSRGLGTRERAALAVFNQQPGMWLSLAEIAAATPGPHTQNTLSALRRALGRLHNKRLILRQDRQTRIKYVRIMWRIYSADEIEAQKRDAQLIRDWTNSLR